MSTINISLTANPAATAISMTAVVRSDTGLPPAGISLPIALSLSGGNWVGMFSDTSPSATYIGTFVLSIGSLNYPPFQDTIVSGAGAQGYYTTQAIIEAVGGFDSDTWSNVSNSSAIPNQARYQSAINRIETAMNSRLMRQSFVAPIPMTHPQFGMMTKIATDYALEELYAFPRGVRGGDKVGGALQMMRDEALQELEELMFLNRGGFQRVAGYSDVGFARATTTPGGTPVASRPPWPIPNWDGYRWVYGNVEWNGCG